MAAAAAFPAAKAAAVPALGAPVTVGELVRLETDDVGETAEVEVAFADGLDCSSSLPEWIKPGSA